MSPAASRWALGGFLVALVAGLAWAETRLSTPLPTVALVALLAGLAAWETSALLLPKRSAPAALALALAVALLSLSADAALWSRASGLWPVPLLAWAAVWLLPRPESLSAEARGRIAPLLWAAGLAYVLQAGYLVGLRVSLGGGEAGLALALLVVGVCKGGDMAAYFVGSRWGRTKMAPRLSPKKTWEGSAAGLCASTAIGILFASLAPALSLSARSGALLGAAVGASGQAGDLLESGLKRKTGVKDSGAWAGLGGALDTLDSLLVAAPAGYHLYQWMT